jgi:hypothetical protein
MSWETDTSRRCQEQRLAVALPVELPNGIGVTRDVSVSGVFDPRVRRRRKAAGLAHTTEKAGLPKEPLVHFRGPALSLWGQVTGSSNREALPRPPQQIPITSAGADPRISNVLTPGFLREPTENTTFGAINNFENLRLCRGILFTAKR